MVHHVAYIVRQHYLDDMLHAPQTLRASGAIIEHSSAIGSLALSVVLSVYCVHVSYNRITAKVVSRFHLNLAF